MLTRTTSRHRPSLTKDIMPFSEYRDKLVACFNRLNEMHRPQVAQGNRRKPQHRP